MILEFIILIVVIFSVLEYLAPKLPSPLDKIVITIVVLCAIFWLLGLVGLVSPINWVK